MASTSGRRHLASLVQLLGIFLLSLHYTAVSMRLVVQRVKSASVSVDDGQIVSQIGPGLLALVGLHEHDTQEHDLQMCCQKLLACKLWPNEESGGLWRHGVKQKQLEILLVSQFTLYGKLSKKNQPDFKRSMKAEPARQLYKEFVAMVRTAYEPDKVRDGVFGAMMDVALVNDGPVTLIIDSDPQAPSFQDLSASSATEMIDSEDDTK
jgi:D-tyrosyl-tRNA(Tyr) deacylase